MTLDMELDELRKEYQTTPFKLSPPPKTRSHFCHHTMMQRIYSFPGVTFGLICPACGLWIRK